MSAVQVSMKLEPEFARQLRDEAKDAGRFPAHIVTGMWRVIQQHDLGGEVRREAALIEAESESRQKIGAGTGGRPRKV